MLSIRNGVSQDAYYVVMPIVAINSNKKHSQSPKRENKDTKKKSDFHSVLTEALKSESSGSLFDSKI